MNRYIRLNRNTLAINSGSANIGIYGQDFITPKHNCKIKVHVLVNSEESADFTILWALVRVKQGYSPNSMSLAVSDLYKPEQDVICYGMGVVNGDNLERTDLLLDNVEYGETTLQQGDEIRFVYVKNGGSLMTSTITTELQFC